MLKYRKQTEKVFEGKHGGTGVRQRNKLKIIIKKNPHKPGKERLECGAKCHHFYVRVCW